MGAPPRFKKQSEPFEVPSLAPHVRLANTLFDLSGECELGIWSEALALAALTAPRRLIDALVDAEVLEEPTPGTFLVKKTPHAHDWYVHGQLRGGERLGLRCRVADCGAIRYVDNALPIEAP